MNTKFLIKIVTIILVLAIMFISMPIKSFAAQNENSGWTLIQNILQQALETISQILQSVFNNGSITLSTTSKNIKVGESFTLTANKPVTWSSSDSSVATVKNGKVTGVKAGTATIKATANGRSAKCTVNVSSGQPNKSFVTIADECKKVLRDNEFTYSKRCMVRCCIFNW